MLTVGGSLVAVFGAYFGVPRGGVAARGAATGGLGVTGALNVTDSTEEPPETDSAID